jgi:hypothetical protein
MELEEGVITGNSGVLAFAEVATTVSAGELEAIAGSPGDTAGDETPVTVLGARKEKVGAQTSEIVTRVVGKTCHGPTMLAMVSAGAEAERCSMVFESVNVRTPGPDGSVAGSTCRAVTPTLEQRPGGTRMAFRQTTIRRDDLSVHHPLDGRYM